MEVKARQCDRCGKLFVPTEGKWRVFEVDQGAHMSQQRDLCPMCEAELDRFMAIEKSA